MSRMTKMLAAPICAALLLLAFAPAASAGAGGVGAAESVTEEAYYLAEGCTRGGFDTWLTVANLNDGTPFNGYPAPSNPPYWTLEVAYTTNDGVVATKSYDLPKQSRTTINVNAEIGAGYDVAFELKTLTNCPGDGGIWIERPMYFSYTGRGGGAPWQGGHVNAAARPTATKPLPTVQYFAEGTTRPGFDEWLCVLNPNDEPANLTFNYMLQGARLQVRTGTVEANHRATWYVPAHVGLDKDVSLELVSDVPVLAERPMYFAYRSVNPAKPGRSWYGGHVISGVPARVFESYDRIQRTFAFAPVSYVPGMGWADTWVCMQNPNDVDVPVQLTFATPGGLMAFVKWLPAQQRSTFYYPELLREYGVASTRDPGAFRVETLAGYPANIQVERPLYMEFDRPAATGQTPSGGTVIAGSSYAGPIYAEGYTGSGFDIWVALNYFDDSEKMRGYWKDALADNSGKWLQTICYFPGREPINWGAMPSTLQASGYQGHWYTYVWHVDNDFPGSDISFDVEQCIYSERIMIFNYAGKWSGMHSSGDGCGH